MVEKLKDKLIVIVLCLVLLGSFMGLVYVCRGFVFTEDNLTNGASWCITIVTSVVLALQIYSQRIYNRQQHESERRLAGAKALNMWLMHVTMYDSICKKIVDTFDDVQANMLMNEVEGVAVTKEQYRKLSIVFQHELNKRCSSNKNSDKSRYYKDKKRGKKHSICIGCTRKDNESLTLEEVIVVRWHVMHYLNGLECVLMQCKSNIVDTDMFFEQMRYQYNKSNGVMSLQKFREAAGGAESFPAIEWFCIEMDRRLRESIGKKAKVEEL